MILQGLGFEVLAQVLESISPSHVMQLTTVNPNNNLPSDMWWLPEGLPTQQNPLVYQLPSVGALQQNMGLESSGILAGFLLSICSKLQPVIFPLATEAELSMHKAVFASNRRSILQASWCVGD